MTVPSRPHDPGSPDPASARRTGGYEVPGRSVRAVEHGRTGARVLLALHGLPGGAEDWDRLAPELAGDFHVVAVDRPGWGGSTGPAVSVAEQTASLVELLDQLAVAERRRAIVVGHSYGAVPAADLAAKHPDLIGALVLVAPALREQRSDRRPPPGTDALERALHHPAVETVLGATLLSEAGRGVLARLLDPVAFRPDPVDEDHVRGVRDRTLRIEALRSFIIEAKALEVDEGRVDRLLGTILTPSVVIHAGGDRVVEPAAGRRTAAAIPGCQLHQIDGGHMVTVSRAPLVARLVRELCARAGVLPSAT